VPPLLIFDAPSLLYRAFYALPDSIRDPSKEHPVNAILGSVNLVLYEWEAHRPRAVVACFGPDAAPYRTELYANYHADRPPMPDGLVWQWERA
jgi:5'-3' exonuclease